MEIYLYSVIFSPMIILVFFCFQWVIFLRFALKALSFSSSCGFCLYLLSFKLPLHIFYSRVHFGSLPYCIPPLSIHGFQHFFPGASGQKDHGLFCIPSLCAIGTVHSFLLSHRYGNLLMQLLLQPCMYSPPESYLLLLILQYLQGSFFFL